MARITTFFENPIQHATSHTDVECGWSIVEAGSDRLLQLDTFGSAGRKFVGKKSQTIQIDRSAAIELQRILKRAFPDAS